MSARFRLRPPILKTTENDVERAVLDLLRLRGFYPLRLHSGLFPTGRTGPDGKPGYIHVGEPGLPDYCVPRFFIETKRPRGGNLSLIQSAKIDELHRFWKLLTAVPHSAEEMIQWLAEHPDL